MLCNTHTGFHFCHSNERGEEKQLLCMWRVLVARLPHVFSSLKQVSVKFNVGPGATALLCSLCPRVVDVSFESGLSDPEGIVSAVSKLQSLRVMEVFLNGRDQVPTMLLLANLHARHLSLSPLDLTIYVASPTQLEQLESAERQWESTCGNVGCKNVRMTVLKNFSDSDFQDDDEDSDWQEGDSEEEGGSDDADDSQEDWDSQEGESDEPSSD